MTSDTATWDDLLDNYEDLLDAYNDALDRGSIPEFEPTPLEAPATAPNGAHLERLAELQAQSGAVEDRLTGAMKDNLDERAADRERLNVHRHYAGPRQR